MTHRTTTTTKPMHTRHREVLRILAARWLGLQPIEGRRLLLATASLSVLGYDHDLTEPVIHAWNGRVTAAPSAL